MGALYVRELSVSEAVHPVKSGFLKRYKNYPKEFPVTIK